MLRHHVNKALYSIPKEAEKYLIEVNTENILDNGHLSAVAQADKLKKIFKQNYWKMMRKVWSEKPMHGKFPEFLKSEYIDLDQSFQWMKYVGLKGETEGLVVAAQDQALKTRYYSKHIMKEGTMDKCRMCHQMPETAEHIMAGCHKLAATQYLDRHNKVAAVATTYGYL